MSQHLIALGHANDVRSYRADIKSQLGSCKVKFADLDLDHDYLQTMKVEQLLRALPWHGTNPRKRVQGTARYGPLKILGAMGLSPNVRFGSLSQRRKEKLKVNVSIICASQRDR